MDDTTHEEGRQAESEWCLGLLNLGHDFAHVELLRLRARELLPLWHICKQPVEDLEANQEKSCRFSDPCLPA
jgi:hypothetical protein